MSTFDTIIPRRGTGCIKYDRKPKLDPFWVADMDFASCPEILDALQQRVAHGVFGYAQAHRGLLEAIANYLQDRHAYALSNEEELVHLSGIVPALSLAARAFCKADEEVLTCTPVYPPFLNVHKDAPGAKLITVDHCQDESGKYIFDFPALEAAVTSNTRIFLLCNPQNPLGRAFSEGEVRQLAKFCQKHGLILVSDEIHCDLILDETKTPHFSALRLPQELRENTITLLAPSKTWNIAGLGYGFAVIPNAKIREQFNSAMGHTLPMVNALAYYAAEAAYRYGEPWRQELLAYLRENRAILDDFFAKKLPQLTVVPGEATYLAWINAEKTGQKNPANFLAKKAKIFVNDGYSFGWPGWFRFNFACPQERLHEGLEKIATVFNAD